jgi:hypothetical protein
MAETKVTPAEINVPFKFYVYLNTATNSPANAFAIVPFDTKVFDTGTNVDVVTNKGRFTAPVAGFYQFNARMALQASARLLVGLYKNGSLAVRGNDLPGSIPIGGTISVMLQLAAGDFIEVGVYSGSSQAYETSAVQAYFQGYLVSTT